MKTLQPFSNATEACYWLDKNCEVCKTSSGCYARESIEKGFITGEISLKIALKTMCHQTMDCPMKNNRKVYKKEKKKLDIPTLF